MAVLAPYGLSTVHADATEPITLTWRNGGDIQHAYEVEIYVNDGSASPFYTSGKTISYTLAVELPANTLVNGVEYKWRVRVYNAVDAVSAWSDYAVVIASSRPVAAVTNVSDTLYSQQYRFTGTYTQAEGVARKAFKFRLYADGSLTEESPWVYDSNAPIETTFALAEDVAYEIELAAVSQHDVEGVSLRVPFSAVYDKPTRASNIVVQNLRDKAAVRVQWVNPQRITLATTASPPQFVAGKYGQALALANGETVSYDGVIDGSFTAMFWVQATAQSGEIARVADSAGNFVAVGYDALSGCFTHTNAADGDVLTRASQPLAVGAGEWWFVAFSQRRAWVGRTGDASLIEF